MADIKCFLIVESGRVCRSLRRYSSGSNNCTGRMSYHDATVPFDEVPQEPGTYIRCSDDEAPPHDDHRWPRRCECGYEFLENDPYQLFHDGIYIRADGTPGEYTLRHAPVGAMWDAW